MNTRPRLLILALALAALPFGQIAAQRPTPESVAELIDERRAKRPDFDHERVPTVRRMGPTQSALP